MVTTATKVRCIVVVAPSPEAAAPRSEPRFRPSDLLPWADPHIRSLVEQLQDQVRQEKREQRAAARPTSSQLEAWVAEETELAAAN